eukprot:1087748-Rhodomonas_salina.2
MVGPRSDEAGERRVCGHGGACAPRRPRDGAVQDPAAPCLLSRVPTCLSASEPAGNAGHLGDSRAEEAGAGSFGSLDQRAELDGGQAARTGGIQVACRALSSASERNNLNWVVEHVNGCQRRDDAKGCQLRACELEIQLREMCTDVGVASPIMRVRARGRH